MRDSATYEEFKTKRASYSLKVLNSTSRKMIVMAGPGTGKSFLFQELSRRYIDEGKSNILVLSFINELVKDLTVDMHGLAEVSTLHSFAAKELGLKQTIYMNLLGVIGKDLRLEKNETKKFDEILHNLEYEEQDVIEYLRKRRDYYKAIDPSSMVYELVEFYKADNSKIPNYDLILVDEYQDFNLLEVELIDLLASKNNILIAGDDDQSLYSFKHSVPDNIRKKYASTEYTEFELPYCSRSTEVVINSFHDVVAKAKEEGLTTDRIEKQYLYFPCEDKDKVSSQYPKIIVKKKVQQSQNAYYIDDEIIKIFESEPKFEVLIICSLKSQINIIGRALRKKGYNNVSGDNISSDKAIELADGLALLYDNKDSNLGWRLCSEALMETDKLKAAVVQSANLTIEFHDCISSDTKTLIKKLRAACVKLKEGKSLDEEQQKLIFDHLEIPITKLGEANARDKIFNNRSNKVHHNTKIKLSTILVSKGLSYDYVFMVNFDDKYLIPSGGIDNESVNKFLVSLTRSKKKISIFTSQTTEPILASWIGADRKKVT